MEMWNENENNLRGKISKATWALQYYPLYRVAQGNIARYKETLKVFKKVRMKEQ